MRENKEDSQTREVQAGRKRQSSHSKEANPNIIQQHNTPKKIRGLAVSFLHTVGQMEDPRTRPCDYPLSEILFIAVCSVLCGTESHEDMAMFGEAQIDWFRQFVPLKNGVPSHDTFRRVLMLLKPGSLSDACNEMFQGPHIDKQGKHIAIDGKASRGCYNVKGQSLLNMVSAWDTDRGICLGHVVTKNDEGKETGEYNAIPKLIEQLDVKDTLVTIDAGGCYAEITGSIVSGGGDYAITLKENQPKLHEMTKGVFDEHDRNDFANVASYRKTNRGHGRVEERTYYAVPVGTDDKRWEKWPKLSTLVMGKFRRETGGKTTEFIRYYISSLPSKDVERLGQSLRGHWGIENGLHWVLDVTFGEDANRTRRGNGAENLSILRRMALGMLNQVKGKKTISNVKFQAAVDPNFRTKMMNKFLMR